MRCTTQRPEEPLPRLLLLIPSRVMPRYTSQTDQMQTYIYYVAEKVAGALEMQWFAHPISVGFVMAENYVEGYSCVFWNLSLTFAVAAQPLVVRLVVEC